MYGMEVGGKVQVNPGFYMPSIPFITAVGTQYSVDLYQRYAGQFSTPVIKNSDAPAIVYQVPQRSDFNYYVIGYDTEVFENIVIGNNGDQRGVMTYDIKSAASDSTYINIVFVLKNN